MLAHCPEPRTDKLNAPVAADDSRDVKNCQPIPDHDVSDSPGLQPHSMFVLLVLLLELLARDGDDVPTVPVQKGGGTQSYVSPSTVTSGMANTSMAMDLIGASSIAVYTGLPVVEWFGLLVAQ